MPDRRALIVSCVLLGTACDSGAPKTTRTEPAPAPPAPAPAKPPEPAPVDRPVGPLPGNLDPDLARAVATAKDVEKLKIEAEADGTFRYASVYHHDAGVLPEPVAKLVEAQFPGSKILRYELESVAGKGRLFEVEVETRDQQKCEFSAKADGTLVYTECEIDPKALPEPVRAALDKAYPGATIKEAEKKTVAGAGDEYEVEFDVGGRIHEFYFRADGTIFRHELAVPAIFEVSVPVP